MVMGLTVTKGAIYDTRDPWKRDREMYDKLVAEGRAARRAHLAFIHCPSYREEDWVISWQMGWRYEDDDIRNRRKS